MLHIARELVVTRRRAQHFFHLGLFFFLLLSLFHSTRRDSIVVWEIEKGPHTIFIWFFCRPSFLLSEQKYFFLHAPATSLTFTLLSSKGNFLCSCFPFQLWNFLLYFLFFWCVAAHIAPEIFHTTTGFTVAVLSLLYISFVDWCVQCSRVITQYYTHTCPYIIHPCYSLNWITLISI